MTRLVWTLPDGQQTARWAEDQSVGGDSLGLFNVIDYGAVGDVTTDDTAACQAAVTAANAYAATHGTAVVYFPTRTFLFDTPSYGYSIMSPTSGVSLVGAGTLKGNGNHGNQIIVDVGGYTDVVVDGLSFDGSDGTDGLSIRVSASFYTQIRNCTFDNVGTSAVYIAGAAEDTTISGCVMRGGLYQILWNDSSTATRTKIVGNTFDGLGELSEAIEINTPSGLAANTQIVGNTFNDFLYNGSNTVACIGIAHAGGVLIEGNTFTNCDTRNIHIEDSTDYISVIGNRFVDAGREAVYIVLGSGAMYNFTISNNEMIGCGYQGYNTIYFIPGGAYSPFENVIVSGNRLYNCGKADAGVPTHGIYIYYVSDGTVSNNVVKNQKGSGGSSRGDGIYLDGTGGSGSLLCTGNVIYGCSSGINVTGAHNNTLISDNCCTGNNANIYTGTSPTGTFVIRGNIGYKTEAEGATSVADGGTITHGLVASPTVVTAETVVTGEVCMVTARSSTTFTVAIKKISDGSAGTTQTINWRATV